MRADSKVEEFMALEASANVQTFQQMSNKAMIDLDQMRNQLSALQKENDSLKEELARQKVGSFIFCDLVAALFGQQLVTLVFLFLLLS